MTQFDRNNPVPLFIVDRYPLTKEDSSKQTWHITLSTEGVDLDYEPGDSIAIYPQNDPTLVQELLDALNVSAQTPITHKRSGSVLTLETFFSEHANLARLTSGFLKLIPDSEELNALLDPENKTALKAYLAEHEPLDFVRQFGSTFPLQDFCDLFGPLLPRFYSVASSKRIDPNRLDLTVALYSWMHRGSARYGVASHFLCHIATIGKTPIPVYVQPAPHFRLPEDPHQDIIMIGPGTGVAPFRAFMQERQHLGSLGRHLLFFGERNSRSDFFYENEWKMQKNLVVHTAFSRDQEEKRYVQHKMLEEAPTLYRLIQEGAKLYVCGDAKEMAKDVEKTLITIFEKEGKQSLEEAKLTLKKLKKMGQYLTDVY